MTFFHCVNCIILTVAPFFIYYKASGLNRLLQGGIITKTVIQYILASIVKFAVTATLANVSSDSQMSLLNELLYSFTYLIDAMWIAHLVNSYKIDVLSRVEIVALGWSATEVILSKIMPILVYSRKPEVDYKWIQFSLDASCDLVFYLSFTLACWLALCAKGKMAPTMVSFVFFGMHILIPGVMSYVKNSELFGGWFYLALHFIVSIALLATGRVIYSIKSETLKA